MLEYVVTLTKDATCIGPEHHERLRAAGFDDRAILQITLIASWFNYINRVADAPASARVSTALRDGGGSARVGSLPSMRHTASRRVPRPLRTASRSSAPTAPRTRQTSGRARLHAGPDPHGAEERAALGRGERARLRGSPRTWAAWRARESRPPAPSGDERHEPDLRGIRARHERPRQGRGLGRQRPDHARRRLPPRSSTTHDRGGAPGALARTCPARPQGQPEGHAEAWRERPRLRALLTVEHGDPPGASSRRSSRRTAACSSSRTSTARAPSRCSTPRAPRRRASASLRSSSTWAPAHSTTGSAAPSSRACRSSAPDSVPSAVFFLPQPGAPGSSPALPLRLVLLSSPEREGSREESEPGWSPALPAEPE